MFLRLLILAIASLCCSKVFLNSSVFGTIFIFRTLNYIATATKVNENSKAFFKIIGCCICDVPGRTSYNLGRRILDAFRSSGNARSNHSCSYDYTARSESNMQFVEADMGKRTLIILQGVLGVITVLAGIVTVILGIMGYKGSVDIGIVEMSLLMSVVLLCVSLLLMIINLKRYRKIKYEK